MAKDSQVNVRFDEATALQLTATAKTLGVSVSQLVRHLTKTFLQDVKISGAVKLSPDWIKMLGVADARSEWGDRKIVTSEMLLNDQPSNRQSPEQKPVKYEAKKPTKKTPKK